MKYRVADLILNSLPDVWSLELSALELDWVVERDEYRRVLGAIETLKADFIQRAILHYTSEEMERRNRAA